MTEAHYIAIFPQPTKISTYCSTTEIMVREKKVEPFCEEHFEKIKDFEKVSYLPHIKYVGTITEEFKYDIMYFTKSNERFQPLAISVENLNKADAQLELCDLQSHLSYQGRTGLDFFKLLRRAIREQTYL